MTWWNTQPVFSTDNIKDWQTIGKIPNVSTEIDGIKMYNYSKKYWKEVQAFLNENYIDGYNYTDDYIQRKLNAPDTTAFVAMEGLNIVGFIWCSRILVNNIYMGYVDFLCVLKKYRKIGLAKKLIENIVNFSNNLDKFLHKKDKNPLPFTYFMYGCHHTLELSKYVENPLYSSFKISNADINLAKLLLDQWYNYNITEHCLINEYWLKSSESVKTYIILDKYLFSYSISYFNYGFYRKAQLAEVFLLTTDEYNEELFKTIITILKKDDIDYLVFIQSPFWKNINSKQSMRVYIHGYNVKMPFTNNFKIPIP